MAGACFLLEPKALLMQHQGYEYKGRQYNKLAVDYRKDKEKYPHIYCLMNDFTACFTTLEWSTVIVSMVYSTLKELQSQ